MTDSAILPPDLMAQSLAVQRGMLAARLVRAGLRARDGLDEFDRGALESAATIFGAGGPVVGWLLSEDDLSRTAADIRLLLGGLQGSAETLAAASAETLAAADRLVERFSIDGERACTDLLPSEQSEDRA